MLPLLWAGDIWDNLPLLWATGIYGITGPTAMATGQKRNNATAQGCSTATEDRDITLNAVV